MPRIKDQAICIRLFDWSETSQVVGLLTQEHGKVRGIAKGAKRNSPGCMARFSGGLELLTLGQVVAAIKPSTELATITEWDLQETWRHFHTDFEAYQLGNYMVDLAGAMLADHDAHPGSFAALRDGLSEMGNPAVGKRAEALLRYQWRLLVDCGYRPELGRDVVTEADLGDQAAYLFDPRAGGVTLQGAAEGDESTRGPWRVRRETVDMLRKVAALPPPEESAGQAERASGAAGEDGGTALTPALSPGERGTAVSRANRLLCVYARAILDRELPTAGIVLGQGA